MELDITPNSHKILAKGIEFNFVKHENMSNFDIKFRGIDDWNRPVYKVVDKQVYFGSTTTLFPNKSISLNNTISEINSYFREHTNELELFGSSFNCEPHGGHSDTWKFNIID